MPSLLKTKLATWYSNNVAGRVASTKIRLPFRLLFYAVIIPYIILIFVSCVRETHADPVDVSKDRWDVGAIRPENFPKIIIQNYYEQEAYITEYTDKGITANGTISRVGGVACQRDIRLGTKIEIEGRLFTCIDRYALWLDKTRHYPTVDIYTEDSTVEARNFGIKKETVKIILPQD